jgi:hypothetical protein
MRPFAWHNRAKTTARKVMEIEISEITSYLTDHHDWIEHAVYMQSTWTGPVPDGRHQQLPAT